MTEDGVALAPRRAWSPPDVDLRSRIIAELGAEVSTLWDLSPYRLVDDGPTADEIVDILFPGDPLLCCAPSLSKSHTAPRSWWRGKMSGLQFMVPSPMSALTGKTQEGRTSARCLGNVGLRRFLVVEQDAGTLDEQAAALLHLG